MSARPLRFCDVCLELDDHPRHVQAVAADQRNEVPAGDIPAGPATAVAQLLSPTTVIRHLNCCAEQGCSTCSATEQVTAGARGAELTAAILGGALDGFTVPTESESDHG